MLALTLFQHSTVGSPAFEKSTEYPELVTANDSLLLSADTTFLFTANKDTTIEDESLNSKIKYHARDSLVSDLVNEVVHLYGGATIEYEDLFLKADYIMIDFNKKELFAEGITDSLGVLTGKPEFSQAGQNFRSNNIRYNFDSKKGKIAYLITKEGEGYIHGDLVKKDPENNFYIRHGQYTTCDADVPHYSIASRKLKVINNNKIVTGPAYLTIETVPTPLFLPFGFFPNSKGRSSGIIFPSFGESVNRGFYFQNLGYYFGFSDYLNFAVTTDVYTKGSFNIFGSSIYANRYRFKGDFRISYLYTVTSEPELPDYSITKDFQVRWKHSQDAKARPNSTFSADVTAGSRSFYRNALSTSLNNFLSNTFQSSVQYSKRWGEKINLAVGLRHDQNTLTHDINVRAPEVSFGVSRLFPFKRKVSVGAEKWYERIGTNYSMAATNLISTKDSLLFKKDSLGRFVSLDNLKNGMLHNVPVSTSFKLFSYFNLTTSVSYTERWYLKSVLYDWKDEINSIDTTVVHGFQAARDYSTSASLSTRVYGMYAFAKGPVAAIRHVFSPTFGFSYRPDFGLERYGYYKTVQYDTSGRYKTYSIFENGVYGSPSNGKFGSLNLNLGNNLEMKVRSRSDTGSTEKKIKILENLNIGASYNLFADSMKLSTIGVRGNTTLLDKINFSFGGVFNPYAVDANNNAYNRFQYDLDHRLARLTNANASLGFALNNANEKVSPRYSSQQLAEINEHPEDYIDFTVPYNLSVNYTYSYSKLGNLAAESFQSASINGDLNVTPKWKVGFNSWYDITNSKFTSFSLNISRDLHCWEMRLNWIPFGYQESYFFQINVKSSILQDLKLIKRKDFYD